ncbi:hypothetical protein SEA_SKOG_64 [Gordonia phage Skog]|uniref:HTH cro/C1-type domain-containing protein n=1 Tax=Gordonia phage Skog TaxID=2704033 RepID=A0A6G6XJL3_9CAUD|nr:hypothetical protein KHQ85_gp064 [Gordonia phage Skog]QIG58216.1 hypothetical protein SEA_SKOG_64 [Gordonia phage Skog]
MFDRDHPELERWLELEDLKYRAALIQARIESGMTIEDLAKACGRSTAALTQMEDLDYDPHLSTLRRYACAVGILVNRQVMHLPDPVPDPVEEAAEAFADEPGETRWRVRVLRLSDSAPSVTVLDTDSAQTAYAEFASHGAPNLVLEKSIAGGPWVEMSKRTTEPKAEPPKVWWRVLRRHKGPRADMVLEETTDERQARAVYSSNADVAVLQKSVGDGDNAWTDVPYPGDDNGAYRSVSIEEKPGAWWRAVYYRDGEEPIVAACAEDEAWVRGVQRMTPGAVLERSFTRVEHSEPWRKAH